MTKKCRLMLVDDHFIVRMGLAASLGLESDMQVVAECDNGEQAADLYEQSRPDIVIMDSHLPGMSGPEAVAAIRQRSPEARVMMLSVRDGEEDIFRALHAGVVGYLHKAARRDDLLAAIRVVASGRTFFPPAIAAKIADHDRHPHLTNRELGVLRLIVDGCSNKEIASALDLSQATVKLHVGHILNKLGVVDRTQAATAAIQRGIVHLE